MLWGVRPRLQAEQVRWSEIVVNERLQVRSSSQWIMVDAGGGCWVQIEGGNERRPESAGEAHVQVWCSWGTFKERVETERAHKDEEEKQEWAMEKGLTELQDEMYRKRHRGTFLFKLADNTVIQSDFPHWSLYYIYSTNLFKVIVHSKIIILSSFQFHITENRIFSAPFLANATKNPILC